MKALQILLLSVFIISCSGSTKDKSAASTNDKNSVEELTGERYVEEIVMERYQTNLNFANPETSILVPEDIAGFKSLDYFEVDESYRIKARFERTEGMPIFEMQTTTDRKPLYTTYGKAHFSLNGKEHTLHIYQNQKLMSFVQYADYLFIPFNDLTNGNETYGGGRYMDLTIPTQGETSITLDFNKVYNPYCAYNSKYSCPIPPAVNNLDTEIKAGVKKYH